MKHMLRKKDCCALTPMFHYWHAFFPELREHTRLITDPLARTQLAMTCKDEDAARWTHYVTHFCYKRSHRAFLRAVAILGSDVHVRQAFHDLCYACPRGHAADEMQEGDGRPYKDCQVFVEAVQRQHRDALVLEFFRHRMDLVGDLDDQIPYRFSTRANALAYVTIGDANEIHRPSSEAVEQVWDFLELAHRQRVHAMSEEQVRALRRLAIETDDTELAAELGSAAWDHVYHAWYDFPPRICEGNVAFLDFLVKTMRWRPLWTQPVAQLDSGMSIAVFKWCINNGATLRDGPLAYKDPALVSWLLASMKCDIKEMWTTECCAMKAAHAIHFAITHNLQWDAYHMTAALDHADLAAVLWMLKRPEQYRAEAMGAMEINNAQAAPNRRVFEWLHDNKLVVVDIHELVLRIGSDCESLYSDVCFEEDNNWTWLLPKR